MAKVFQPKSKRTRSVRQYKNSAGVVFHCGDTVGLTRKAFRTYDPTPPLFAGSRILKGRIVALLPDVSGLVQVQPKLGGFWTWHVDDLRKARGDHA